MGAVRNHFIYGFLSILVFLNFKNAMLFVLFSLMGPLPTIPRIKRGIISKFLDPRSLFNGDGIGPPVSPFSGERFYGHSPCGNPHAFYRHSYFILVPSVVFWCPGDQVRQLTGKSPAVATLPNQLLPLQHWAPNISTIKKSSGYKS